MGTSNLTEASRIQLTFVFRAWCLIVEHKASPTFLVGIEMKLRETPEYIYGNISDYSPGDFRQWDRWRKGEYLPSHISFNKLNNNAIKFGWMDKSFGDVLLKVYKARSGLTPNMDACCGWDKLVALKNCEEYAIENKLDDLIEHCKNWRLNVDGPSIYDEDAIKKWLDGSENFASFVENEGIKEEILICLSKAVKLAYESGVTEPYKLILNCLNPLIRSPKTVIKTNLRKSITEIIIESYKLALHNKKHDPYMQIKSCIKVIKATWPEVKIILDKDEADRISGVKRIALPRA